MSTLRTRKPEATGLPTVVEELDNAYPTLVDNVDTSSLTSTGGVGDLGGQADNTISKVLAWRGQTTDVAGFQAALKACFTLTESQGHVVTTYTPRALSIQAGLGALTGAQASLYARAVSMQSLVLPQLNSLTVLDPTADREDVEALRVLVRESVLELVNEMGQVGGPRIPRVNTLFEMLTGTLNATGRPVSDALDISNQLGQLRDRFGLLRVNVNDLDDEQVLTSFYTIVDAIVSLQSSWIHQRKGFSYAAGGDDFIGSITTKLSWALAAAAQQLTEVRFLLGSVFLRDAELQTILVSGCDGLSYEAMPLSDLLSWLEDFVVVRGPRLVAESGRDGIAAAFAPMAATLTDLIEGLIANPQPDVWPKGMQTIRVTNGFSELATYMRTVLALVEPISRYGVTIADVEASQITTAGYGGNTWMITILGSGFLPEHSVVMRSGRVSVEGVTFGIQSVSDPDGTTVSMMRVIVMAPDRVWTVAVLDGQGREQATAQLSLDSTPPAGPPPATAAASDSTPAGRARGSKSTNPVDSDKK